MGGVLQFFGQVLTGPVFVMVAPAPEPGSLYVINAALVGNPDFVAVLAIAQGKLGPGVNRQSNVGHGVLVWSIEDAGGQVTGQRPGIHPAWGCLFRPGLQPFGWLPALLV